MNFMQNVPGLERIVRIIIGIGMTVAGTVWAFSGEPLWGTLVGASGVGLAATGLSGWCPACAMVGRKLPKSGKIIPTIKI